ncbi:MAG TPA: adenylate/guanylate cyclase domain-containing protein [Nocardioides sp.]|nr:adenylate/guanylate cyclase domain-containing protein [Nocardioides sp.]
MGGFDLAAYVPRALLGRAPGAPRSWRVEGTLMFVDISGFTSLSDQLARRGHEGSEDLTRTIVRIFTVLLSASDDGGDVIKFGGDAMLVSYTGPGHAARACHAAAIMQRVIRVIGNVRLTGARARLRMSIGIHSGDVDLVLTGGAEHQDLVAIGPTVTQTLELEGRADAGEILVSDETRALLAGTPGVRLGRRKGPGTLLSAMAGLPSTGSQILFRAPTDDQVLRYLPRAFHGRTELMTGTSDHRRAAVGFVQVSGLDAALASDPAGTVARMDRLAEVVADAAADAAVTVLETDASKDGYKYILAAGVPTAQEDPEGRLLRTLLRVTGTDTGLAVRAGCNAGPVFSGTVGAPFRSSYSVMGDAVNVAARFCAHAVPGEVLTTEALLNRSLTEFARGAARTAELKGKPEPVTVVPVTAVVGQRGRTQQRVAFVGRERERARVRAAFAGVREGRGAVVQLVGEAGLGKSRLADVALQDVGLTPKWFTCDPYGAQDPFHTMRTVLRHLLDIDMQAPPELAGARLADCAASTTPETAAWLPLVADVIGARVAPTPEVDALDERFRTDRMRDAVRVLLRELMPEPVALVVDDAQWVDEASADTLAVVLADAPERPWAVVLARRDGTDGLHLDAIGRDEDGGDEAGGAVEVRLEPFPQDVALDLLTAQGQVLRPDEADAIVGRGGGNPYFLLQLAEGAGSDGLPDTVEELVGTRIDAIEPAERELVRNASVLGTRFRSELYVAATGDHDFPDAVTSAALTPYLRVSDGEVRFTRELYREVAYGQLTFRGRRQLHREVARAIEQQPALGGASALPMLSLHYDRGHQWEESWAASRAAGREAARVYANDEAIGFFQRALAAGRKVRVGRDELASVEELLADACQTAGRFDEAIAAYRWALRTRRAAADKVRLLVKAGRVHDQCGEFARAGRLYRIARRYADAPDVVAEPVLLAEVDLGDAASHYFQGRLAEARSLAERAWDGAVALPDKDRTRRARARAAFLYDSAAGALDGPGALRFGDLALRTYEQMGDWYYAGIACNNLGSQAWREGRWDEAIAYYRRGSELALRAGDRLSASYMSMNLAEMTAVRGDPDGAEADVLTALRTFRALRAPVGVAASLYVLSTLELQRGDVGAARAALDEGRAVAADTGSKQDIDEGDEHDLAVLLAEGADAAVVERAPVLLARDPEPMYAARIHRWWGIALHRLGDPAAAEAALEESLHIATDLGARHEIACTEAALGRLGGPRAETYRARAASGFARLGIPERPRAD